MDRDPIVGEGGSSRTIAHITLHAMKLGHSRGRAQPYNIRVASGITCLALASFSHTRGAYNVEPQEVQSRGAFAKLSPY